MAINEKCFIDFNLNLMTTFIVVYRECSVSRAALCLGVKQPAVSNSLAQLRLHFRDRLFLRAEHGVRPTAKAIKIATALIPAMNRIELLLVANR
ncbi:LysR family transcriptional regulator [Pseudomonas sp. SZMC_28357]|jgi:LysR family transcriptional activator of mexEF-oprN operon|uniref:LysR family transcriptional regulator n=1 Tax=Pseudomonas sp. SZMC_28357 TaxID=3074380 RepID=UPI00287261A8|nr:LysR family transcriptional regulator [Pseudomonas sp. SZMC_28357]MDR9753367.1 LysR family transcriptional regulator [Pseudomonas sp. SZMC_28357]